MVACGGAQTLPAPLDECTRVQRDLPPSSPSSRSIGSNRRQSMTTLEAWRTTPSPMRHGSR
jgi:hypothetical protein